MRGCALNQLGCRRFTREEESIGHNLGKQGGAVVFNTCRHEGSLSSLSKAESLLEVTRILNSEHDPQRLVQEAKVREDAEARRRARIAEARLQEQMKEAKEREQADALARTQKKNQLQKMTETIKDNEAAARQMWRSMWWPRV